MRHYWSRKRVCYLIAIAVLVVLGLGSRRIEWLPDQAGDMLWTMMVFCCWRILLAHADLKRVAIITLIFSFAIEFQQLIRWDWLVSLRSTTLGHLVLGQGFLWTDLIAYIIGTLIIYLLAKAAERRE
ncbi:MAG: DUF2809 domain-containing protein [Bacteroidaceae bacterium]|nr:DUF2809 domain-containing protein [Bacteroidaceae bacterium]